MTVGGFRSLDELFGGRHFDQEVIVLCVRWYLRFKLSYRDLVEMMAERGLPMAHTTIMRWVHHYVPEFERRWYRFARPVGHSWRVDETYVKIRGEWVYPYRAADREGSTVDFRLSTRRDVAAAKAFFRKAIKRQGSTPRTITLDGYAASHRAVREMKAEGSTCPGHEVAVIKVSHQSDRTGPPRREAPHRSDARLQTVQDRGDHHCRHRALAPDPKGPMPTSGNNAFTPGMCMPSGTWRWRRNRAQIAERHPPVSG